MKTQNTNLSFDKNSLIELNDSQLDDVKGGTTIVCSNCFTITIRTFLTR
ncbi:class I lanthipeptide [Lacinutrix sp.]|nr:class I lanthipeptide [Lacinutrix sp.]